MLFPNNQKLFGHSALVDKSFLHASSGNSIQDVGFSWLVQLLLSFMCTAFHQYTWLGYEWYSEKPKTNFMQDKTIQCNNNSIFYLLENLLKLEIL